jgi:cytoskeletal protein CcmA (bactofilin family)
MSVFRNTRPGEGKDEPAAPNRFGDSILPRPEGNGDLLQNAVEPVEPPRPTFTAFPSDRDNSRSGSSSSTSATNRNNGGGNGATAADQCANVIASGSKWSGTLNIDDSVRIEGNLTGEVVAKGTVHIADGARVEAKIRAAYIVISGSFKGELRCDERLELMPKSRVEGEMITKLLNVHEGAIVDGSIQMASEPSTSEARRSKEPAATA